MIKHGETKQDRAPKTVEPNKVEKVSSETAGLRLNWTAKSWPGGGPAYAGMEAVIATTPECVCAVYQNVKGGKWRTPNTNVRGGVTHDTWQGAALEDEAALRAMSLVMLEAVGATP